MKTILTHKMLYGILVLQMVGLLALYGWHQAGLGAPTVMLKTLPVDPRDLLRGDYIILNYEISRLPAEFSDTSQDGMEVFVILKEENGFAAADRVQGWRPGRGERFIRGVIRGARIEFDLEKCFVPEGMGNPPLPITVEVAIRGNGRALIKQLYAEGKPWPPRQP